jgi:hypothetical protein
LNELNFIISIYKLLKNQKMKRNLFLLSAMALVITGAMFWSCQKEEMMYAEEGMLKKASIKIASGDMLDWTGIICADVAHEFTLTFPQDYTGGPSPSTKTTNGQVHLKYIGDDPETIEVETDAEYWEQIGNGSGNTEFSFNYKFESAGTYDLKYKASDSKWSNVTVTVVNCGCNYDGNELNAELLSVSEVEDMDGWYEFVVKWTFTSEEGTWVKIKGGLTAGGKDGVIVVDVIGADTDFTFVGLPEKNAQVEWSGLVEECGEKEITVTFQRKWDGECDDITGDWTAENAAGVEIGYAAEVTAGNCEEIAE